MKQAAVSVSVIICAYTEKRWNDLKDAVASVQQQSCLPAEIIVVIDHNSALFKRAQENLTGITVIENSRAKGLSGARNSGWTTAQGDIVAFLDDDAIAQPDWIEHLMLSYANPGVIGVGGRIEPRWFKSSPFWFPAEFNWVVGCTYKGLPVKNARIRNVIGANMSMRRDVLAQVGGFRESFGCDKDSNTSQGTLKWFKHYAGDEETELCIRVSQHLPGSVWLYAGKAVVQHFVSAERTRWKYFLWRCYDEGLGKASLVKLHGNRTSLSSEQAYVFQALPQGILRGLADALLRQDLGGLARAGAIFIGLAMTTTGYLVGSTIYHS